VVADDASTDPTADVARELGARVVSVYHRQISATRNAGARAARGEFLIFVDADTVVTEAVVHAAAAAMRCGAVGSGSAFRFDDRLPLHSRILQAIAVPLYRACRLASGCFLFCTREAFDAVGGFDETLLVAEEGDMSLRLRRHGRFVILRHCVTTSGRKLRTYSARELLGLMARLLVAGPRGWRRRAGLETWYGERRADPESVFAQSGLTAASLREASTLCTPPTSPSSPTSGRITLRGE
jgi:glycosyltransferase involved in cell wall biosynthesis